MAVIVAAALAMLLAVAVAVVVAPAVAPCLFRQAEEPARDDRRRRNGSPLDLRVGRCSATHEPGAGAAMDTVRSRHRQVRPRYKRSPRNGELRGGRGRSNPLGDAFPRRRREICRQSSGRPAERQERRRPTLGRRAGEQEHRERNGDRHREHGWEYRREVSESGLHIREIGHSLTAKATLIKHSGTHRFLHHFSQILHTPIESSAHERSTARSPAIGGLTRPGMNLC
jgi:hypothetical protein